MFARGVRVGPGSRLPRLPALTRRKNDGNSLSNEDPDGFPNDGESVWRSNYSSLEDKVREVLEATRGQVLKLSENEAKERYPKLVVASLGALRKDKKDGTYTARVLSDGTNGSREIADCRGH